MNIHTYSVYLECTKFNWKWLLSFSRLRISTELLCKYKLHVQYINRKVQIFAISGSYHLLLINTLGHLVADTHISQQISHGCFVCLQGVQEIL